MFKIKGTAVTGPRIGALSLAAVGADLLGRGSGQSHLFCACALTLLEQEQPARASQP